MLEKILRMTHSYLSQILIDGHSSLLAKLLTQNALTARCLITKFIQRKGTFQASRQPGNRPAGVMPQTKSIAVKCTNVAAQAYLTMRLEASAVSGQAMVSDNQDLGFIVADQNDTPITPNDLNSVIPFRLDAAAAANVTLRAWPISITGQKPTEGPFSALGYLRVDYQ